MPINYPGSDSWITNIREYATTDPATGGTGGAANLPIEDLADRTQYLNAEGKRNFKRAVEAASGGRATIMWDALGEWHLMISIPPFNPGDIDANLGNGPTNDTGYNYHPAFQQHSVTPNSGLRLWVAAVPVMNLGSGRLASQPISDRGNYNGPVPLTLAGARAYAATLGPGWHVMNAPEWGALGLLSRFRAIQQRGNTNYGTWHYSGTTAPYSARAPYSEADGRTKTMCGQGPDEWSHDGSPFGVKDLVGNYREHVDGIYTDSGRLYVLTKNWDLSSGSCVVDEGDMTDTEFYFNKDGSGVLRYDSAGVIDNAVHECSLCGITQVGLTDVKAIFATPTLVHLLLNNKWYNGSSVLDSDFISGTYPDSGNDVTMELANFLNTTLSAGITTAGIPGAITEKLEAAKHYFTRGGQYDSGEDAGLGCLTWHATDESYAFRLAYVEVEPTI